MKKSSSQNIIRIGINYADPLETMHLDALIDSEEDEVSESDESEQPLFGGMLSFY